MKKGTFSGYFSLLFFMLSSEITSAQIIHPAQTDSYSTNPRLILDSYTFGGSIKTWFNKDDGSLLVFDKITETIDTIATLHSGFFEPTTNGFYVFGDGLSFVNIRDTTITPIDWNTTNEFIQYFKLIHSTKAVLLVFSAYQPQYYVLDLKTTKSKPIRNPDPYEKPVGIEAIGDHIFMATTHTFHTILLESGKWLKLSEKSSDTGWINGITASKKEVFLSTDKGFIFRFDGKEPVAELTQLNNTPPFLFTIFESSQNGTLAVAFENRIAIYKPKLNDWQEIPVYKLTSLVGEIRKINFINDETLLITTGQSFGLVSIKD